MRLLRRSAKAELLAMTQSQFRLREELSEAKRRGDLELKMNKQSYVYILTNKRNKVLYTGVTSDLQKRVYQHKMKSVSGFTKKYNVNKLIYYEVFNDICNAIEREKQIKSGSRQDKIDLVNSFNPEWKDLFDDL